jgi:hypothetical protein
MSHAQLPSEVKEAKKIDFGVFLDRLITVRLFIQEARQMGIADLPDIRGTLDRFSEALLRRLYEREIVKDVTADAAEVEKAYRERVKEWKIDSLMFKNEDEAKKTAARIKEGMSFAEAGAEAIREGTASGPGKAAAVRAQGLQPQVAAVLSAMQPGAVSDIIVIGAGKGRVFSLVKLEETGYPENADERAITASEVLTEAQKRRFAKHRAELVKRLVSTDTKALKAIDYEAKNPGLDRLEKDQRVVARVRGEEPIRVADLTAALKKKFFHGMEQAAQSKKINREKTAMLHDLIDKKLFRREALKLGLDRRTEYTALIKEVETTALFGAFVTRVVQPGVKVTEEEKTLYYREHLDEFKTPDSMNLSGLAFSTARDAERAREQLKKGADLGWLREHAEGRVTGEAADLARWDGRLTVVGDLPKEIAEAVAGARSGDLRLAGSAGGTHYLIVVNEVVPGKALPLEAVGKTIEKRLLGENLNKAVESWGEKLRGSSEVAINLVEYRHETAESRAR